MKMMKENNRTCLTLLAVAVALLLTGSPVRASDNESIDTEVYNRKLPVSRAEAGQEHHIRQGVARDNLSVKSFGEEMPAVNKQIDEGRPMNRRVDFIITK